RFLNRAPDMSRTSVIPGSSFLANRWAQVSIFHLQPRGSWQTSGPITALLDDDFRELCRRIPPHHNPMIGSVVPVCGSRNIVEGGLADFATRELHVLRGVCHDDDAAIM